jgi:hypothetical protein
MPVTVGTQAPAVIALENDPLRNDAILPDDDDSARAADDEVGFIGLRHRAGGGRRPRSRG